MEATNFMEYVTDLEQRLQTIQQEFLASHSEKAQLVGPLLAITMLVKSDLIPFARDRYAAMSEGAAWKMADDYLLSLRSEVELILAGPMIYQKQGNS